MTSTGCGKKKSIPWRFLSNISPTTEKCSTKFYTPFVCSYLRFTNFYSTIEPMALDPLLVFRFALGRLATVGGKCRPIMLLWSDCELLYSYTLLYFYCPGQYPSIVDPGIHASTHPPLSCRGGQLISYLRTLWHSPPRHLPLPRKQLSRTLLPGLC